MTCLVTRCAQSIPLLRRPGIPETCTGRVAAGPWRPPPGRQVMSSGQDERLGSKGDLVKSAARGQPSGSASIARQRSTAGQPRPPGPPGPDDWGSQCASHPPEEFRDGHCGGFVIKYLELFLKYRREAPQLVPRSLTSACVRPSGRLASAAAGPYGRPRGRSTSRLSTPTVADLAPGRQAITDRPRPADRLPVLRMHDLCRRPSSTRPPSALAGGRRRPRSPFGHPGTNPGVRREQEPPQPIWTSTPPTVRLPRLSTRNLPCSRSLAAGTASRSVTLALFR